MSFVISIGHLGLTWDARPF